jgi:predicted membrane protein
LFTALTAGRLLPTALLILSAAGFLFTALTARCLLTFALLTAALILFTIVCHFYPSYVRSK